MTPIRIEAHRPDLEEAFLRLHDDGHGAGWCRCVAWWVPTWDGWGDRTAAENLALRCSLHAQGEHDGLLAFVGDEVVGWVQAGPRDRLPKLVAQLGLEPDARAWATTCFLVAPVHRRRGVATALLRGAVDAARAAGATRVEGYPRVGSTIEDGDAWTGAEALFEREGFARLRVGEPRSLYALEL